MKHILRKANSNEISGIWKIVQEAIFRRKADGSQQWQDGYPNEAVITADVTKGHGFVLTDGISIVGYCAILINDEPEYANLEGNWLTNEEFLVFHRVAIAENSLGKGLAQEMFGLIEDFARQAKIRSVKVDTNFDNAAMLNIFHKRGYVYCGEVYFRGSARRAYEKVISLVEQ